MNLNLKVEGVAEVQSMLAGLKGAQVRKAVTLWSNWVGLEAQGEMRRAIGSRFTFRGTDDGFRKAVVFQQATQRGSREVKAELKVGGPGFGQSRTQKLGQILARHEDADTRTESAQVFYNGRGQAMMGLGFFVPAKGMRTSSANPPRGLYPRAIGAAMRFTPDSVILAKGTKKGSKAKGTGRSYFATRKGIFERRHTGFGGRVDVRAIWFFSNVVRTPARLGLWQTAEKVFQVRAVALGLQAIDEVLFREALADSQRGAPKSLR
jgi:hypothetical protein